MASATKKCRVCGKEYEACRSADRAAGVFRWQEVACSPECGAKYLEQIIASRNPDKHIEEPVVHYTRKKKFDETRNVVKNDFVISPEKETDEQVTDSEISD